MPAPGVHFNEDGHLHVANPLPLQRISEGSAASAEPPSGDRGTLAVAKVLLSRRLRQVQERLASQGPASTTTPLAADRQYSQPRSGRTSWCGQLLLQERLATSLAHLTASSAPSTSQVPPLPRTPREGRGALRQALVEVAPSHMATQARTRHPHQVGPSTVEAGLRKDVGC